MPVDAGPSAADQVEVAVARATSPARARARRGAAAARVERVVGSARRSQARLGAVRAGWACRARRRPARRGARRPSAIVEPGDLALALDRGRGDPAAGRRSAWRSGCAAEARSAGWRRPSAGARPRRWARARGARAARTRSRAELPYRLAERCAWTGISSVIWSIRRLGRRTEICLVVAQDPDAVVDRLAGVVLVAGLHAEQVALERPGSASASSVSSSGANTPFVAERRPRPRRRAAARCRRR